MHFVFRDVTPPADQWWLVVTAAEVDVCDVDPGHPVAITVDSDLRSLTQTWRGDLSWSDALRTDEVTLIGPAQTRRAVPRWLKLSTFAPVARAATPLPPMDDEDPRTAPHPVVALTPDRQRPGDRTTPG